MLSASLAEGGGIFELSLGNSNMTEGVVNISNLFEIL